MALFGRLVERKVLLNRDTYFQNFQICFCFAFINIVTFKSVCKLFSWLIEKLQTRVEMDNVNTNTEKCTGNDNQQLCMKCMEVCQEIPVKITLMVTS